jgi:hypothetical protein
MFRLKQGVRLLGAAGMTALLLWLTMMPVVSPAGSRHSLQSTDGLRP